MQGYDKKNHIIFFSFRDFNYLNVFFFVVNLKGRIFALANQ